MLCDRETVNVASSQPGFINFVPLPIFTALSNVMPDLQDLVSNMKQNSKEWKTYEETEKDKEVYKKKDTLRHQNLLKEK